MENIKEYFDIKEGNNNLKNNLIQGQVSIEQKENVNNNLKDQQNLPKIKNKNLKNLVYSKLPTLKELNEANKNDLIDIKLNIDKQFAEANDYLNSESLNKKIYINKRLKGPRFNKDGRLVPYSIIGSVSLFNNMSDNSVNNNLKYNKVNTKLTSTSSSQFSFKQTKKESKFSKNSGSKISKINFNQLDEIFQNFYEHKKHSMPNDFLDENLPDEIKDSLLRQEKYLISQKKTERITNFTKKFISSKLKNNSMKLERVFDNRKD